MESLLIVAMLINMLFNSGYGNNVLFQDEMVRCLYEEKETQNKLEIYYQNEEDFNTLIETLEDVSNELLNSVNKIILYSNEKESNVAGITQNRTIRLYEFSKYSNSTRKRILYHELAHILGNELLENKIIDYDYTEYKKMVEKDGNYIDEYSKKYILEKNRYSEDFAESVAMYLINKENFEEKYKNRSEYIEKVLKI